MRALRAERDAVRAALPAAQVPALLPAPSSDDPEELLEQADALRDAGDKVKQRLAALESRIAEAREERDLDRRMGDFLGEGAMFDEQDRRLRLDRDPHAREFGYRPAGGAQDSFAGAPGVSGHDGQPPAARAPDTADTADSRATDRRASRPPRARARRGRRRGRPALAGGPARAIAPARLQVGAPGAPGGSPGARACASV